MWQSYLYESIEKIKALTFFSFSIRGKKWVLSSWGLDLLMIGWENTATCKRESIKEKQIVNNILHLSWIHMWWGFLLLVWWNWLRTRENATWGKTHIILKFVHSGLFSKPRVGRGHIWSLLNNMWESVFPLWWGFLLVWMYSRHQPCKVYLSPFHEIPWLWFW